MGICFIIKVWKLSVSFALVGMFNSNNNDVKALRLLRC